MLKTTKPQIDALRRSLRQIAETQADFWDALYEFEKLSGVELTSFANDFTQFAEPTEEDVAWVMKNYIEGRK